MQLKVLKEYATKKYPERPTTPAEGRSDLHSSGRVCAASSGPLSTMAHPGEMEVHDGQPTPEEGHNPKREQQR